MDTATSPSAPLRAAHFLDLRSCHRTLDFTPIARRRKPYLRAYASVRIRTPPSNALPLSTLSLRFTIVYGFTDCRRAVNSMYMLYVP